MIWIIAFIVSTIFELLALNTPINIFGSKYKYNLKKYIIKYSFAGLPWLNPIVWATAKTIFGSLSSFLLFALFLEPMAIKLGWWKYKRKGLWFGVPLTVFLGYSIIWVVTEYGKNYLAK